MKTKFKDGEWVICDPKNCVWKFSGYRKGDLYQVKNTYMDSDGERIKTVVDANGSTTNGWHVKHFEPAFQSQFEFEGE